MKIWGFMVKSHTSQHIPFTQFLHLMSPLTSLCLSFFPQPISIITSHICSGMLGTSLPFIFLVLRFPLKTLTLAFTLFLSLQSHLSLRKSSCQLLRKFSCLHILTEAPHPADHVLLLRPHLKAKHGEQAGTFLPDRTWVLKQRSKLKAPLRNPTRFSPTAARYPW